MDENEARSILADIIADFYWGASSVKMDGRDIEAMEMAVKALDEIQQYQSVGSVDECKKAIEKQKPKDAMVAKTLMCDSKRGFECPVCGKMLGIYKNYCAGCGQHVKCE